MALSSPQVVGSHVPFVLGFFYFDEVANCRWISNIELYSSWMGKLEP
jgi:hypothetical protein